MEIKAKTNEWNQLKLKSFYIAEKNHKQNKKTTHRMGENICKQCDWQGVNLQNLQTVHEAQYQKQITQSSKEHRWPKAREKILNFANY